MKIPFFVQEFTNEMEEAAIDALRNESFVNGESVSKFEEEFARYIGTKYAVSVNSGNSALQISLMALDISTDSKVATPTNSFIASANCIRMTNAQPILTDIDTRDGGIDVSSITEKVDAIIPVHIYGNPCDFDSVKAFAEDEHIPIVEDACQAHGATYKNKKVGSLSDVGCFSFYPTKNITTAEGGMVTTNSKKIAEKIRQLRSHGMTKSLKSRYSSGYPWIFDIVEPGYNYRMDEIRAALGITQLKRINKINELRKNASLYYHKNLQNIPGIILPDMVNDKSHSYHLYTIRVTKPFKLSRNQLFKKLKNNGIRTTVYWMPIHKYSAFRKFAKVSNVVNTSKTYNEILALPLFPTISKKHQDSVIKIIKSS